VLARPGQKVVAPAGQQAGGTAGVRTWFTYGCQLFSRSALHHQCMLVRLASMQG